METARIAQVLDEMGTILEIQGENPFRCRAYHNAAQTLMSLPADLSEMIADGSLAEVPGIGETMHAKIVQLATTGQLPAYDELREATPPGLLALLRVPGLGPKKIKALHETLKIESLADLRAAAEAGKIAKLKGFGAKTEAKILEGIAFLETTGERILQHEALAARRARSCELIRGHRQVDPGRGLRQPAAPGRDDRRPRHPVQRDGPGAGARRVRRLAAGRQGPRPRADQGERLLPGFKTGQRPVRPARGRGQPVPVRAPLLHRARRPTTSRCASGPWPGGCRSTSTPWPARRAGRLPHRGRPVRGARAGLDPSRAARGHRARSRRPRRDKLPEPGRRWTT